MVNQQVVWLRFWGMALVLNGVLAGSRWLVRPWETTSQIGLTLGVAVVVFLFFFVSAYIVANDMFPARQNQLVPFLLPAVGGVMLMAWGSSLPLWNEWILGLALSGVLVPLLLLSGIDGRLPPLVGLGMRVVLLAILWQTLLGENRFQGWRWVVAIGVALILIWLWFRQIQEGENAGVYTAVAAVAFLQLGLVALFLPFSTTAVLFVVSLLLGGVCWLGSDPIGSS